MGEGWKRDNIMQWVIWMKAKIYDMGNLDEGYDLSESSYYTSLL